MKRLVIACIVVLGCNAEGQPYKQQETYPYLHYRNVEDCQYLIFSSYPDGSGVVGVVHKGNCLNPIHNIK
jgi:hypothetical protein